MDARPVFSPDLPKYLPENWPENLPAHVCKDLWCGLGMPRAGLVALVGGGGKTTLMYRLAAEAARRGILVVCSTTTRIFCPRIPQDTRALFLRSDPAQLLEDVRHAPSPSVICSREDNGKLMGLAPKTLDALANALPDHLFLVEADGAAMRPLKAPAAHEPVFPATTSLAIALMGLEAMGRPITPDHVHRPERVQALTALLPGELIDIAAIHVLVEHAQGWFQHCPPTARRVVFGNKADAVPPPEGWPWLFGSVLEGWCASHVEASPQPAERTA